MDELRSTLLRKMDFDDSPVKPQRAFMEMNEFFDGDEIIVTAIGLYQIFSGQFQEDLQAAPLPLLRAGRSSRMGGPGVHRGEGG